MKTLIIIVLFPVIFAFSGCDYLMTFNDYYVTVVNDDYDKYITGIYHRSNNYYEERWSKNNIYDYIYPNESDYFRLMEGIYDFKIILEDDYYSYTVYEYDVQVYRDLTLYVNWYKTNNLKEKVLKSNPLNQTK